MSDQNLIDSNDRRRVPRRAMHHRVGLLISGEYVIGVAKEIGEGGMAIESPLPLTKGQRVVISLRLPGILNGVMRAKVMYVQPQAGLEPARYGLQFENIEFEIKRKIRLYVASSNSSLGLQSA